jgi:hypothetical protein
MAWKKGCLCLIDKDTRSPLRKVSHFTEQWRLFFPVLRIQSYPYLVSQTTARLHRTS